MMFFSQPRVPLAVNKFLFLFLFLLGCYHPSVTVTAQLAVDGSITVNGGSTNPALDYTQYTGPTDDATIYVYESTNRVPSGGSITCTATATAVGGSGLWYINIKYGSVQTDFINDGTFQTDGASSTNTQYTIQNAVTNNLGTDAIVFVAAMRNGVNGASGVTVSCVGDTVATPSPTTSPTTSSSATTSPTAAPTASACFSESATVQVFGEQEPLKMKDLQVGQQIFVGKWGGGENEKPTYETVYGFAHRDVNGFTEYLQIITTTTTTSQSLEDGYCSNNDDATDSNKMENCCKDNSDDRGPDTNNTTGTTSTLEISPNHLIFVWGQQDPISAGSLQVGDLLIQPRMDDDKDSTASTKSAPARIISIERIRQRGLYAPLTQDGTMIVDGIHVSCYVSIKHLGVPKVIKTTRHYFNNMSEQTLFHLWMSPYRVVCFHLAPELCLDDYSNEYGYIHWLVLGRKIAEIAEQHCSNIFIVFGLIVVFCFCGIWMLLEYILDNDPIFWLVQVACCIFLFQQYNMPSLKKLLLKKSGLFHIATKKEQ